MKSLIVILSVILASTATHATPQSVTVSTTSGRTYAVAFDPNKFAGALVQLRELKQVYNKQKRRYITSYTEWLNSADAGRNLQTALHTNERGECYNPTQGGNWTEYSKTYASQLVEYWTGPNALHTKTRMAFWLRPGDTRRPQPGYCPLSVSENKTLTSDYYVTHDVSFSSVAGAMLMTFNVTVDTPESNNSVVWETLTGYMHGSFKVFYKYDKATQTLLPGPTSPNEQPYPVVLSATSSQAIGIYCPGANYSAYDFAKLASIYVTKWNGVHRTGFTPSGLYQATCYVPVGSVSEVTAALRTVVK